MPIQPVKWSSVCFILSLLWPQTNQWSSHVELYAGQEKPSLKSQVTKESPILTYNRTCLNTSQNKIHSLMFQSESLNLLISDSTATLRNVTHCLPSSTPIVFCLKKPGTTMIKITDDSKTWVRVGFYPWSKEKEQSKTRLWNSKALDKLTALGPTANTSIRTWSGCLVHRQSSCLSPNGSGIRENRQEV